ncbi:MAG TPA: endonuclease [Phycisphaerae bacterium]|nr:endonuclease [Phycisphaerae bacterium]
MNEDARLFVQSRARCAPRRIAAVLLVAILVVGLSSAQRAAADPPPGYYNTVDTTTAAGLRSTLHNVIDDHTRFPYTASSTDTWNILESAQQDPGNPGKIIDIYRNRSYTKIGGGVGPYNREHTWPKSYGFPDDGGGNYPYTDCHQLHLCDADYNSSRSNKPFRNCSAGCSEKTTDFNLGQGGGSGTYPGNSNWTSGAYTQGTWEVWIGRRGDIARAQFYLDVRYEGGVHGVTGYWEPDLILTNSEALIDASNTGNNEHVAYMGILSVLLQWHLEDPVDDLERNRNDVVFSFQGNRNPFVDHPEWVDCLYNGVCGCSGDPDCDDSLYCNGAETCVASQCQPGTPVDCDDAVACTDDSCNETTDSCDNVPNDAVCGNGLYCDGSETCDTQSGCLPGSPACSAGTWCDETGDTCVAYGDGDFDADSDVDMSDYDAFQRCFAAPAAGACEPGNLSGDGTIDLADYAEFQFLMGGPL